MGAVTQNELSIAHVIHTYGGATRFYQAGGLTTWEQLTDVNLASVTTTDADSTGTTLNVTATTCFKGCELNTSSIMVGGRKYYITGITTGESLTVSPAIVGTIASGTAVSCGFVLNCYADASSYNDYVDMAGATDSATYYRVIQPALGQWHNGTATTGVYFNQSSSDFTIKLSETNCRLYGLVVGIDRNNTNNIDAILTGSGVVNGCIINHAIQANAGGVPSGIRATNGAKISNCIISNVYGGTSVGMYDNSTGTNYWYNNTQYGGNTTTTTYGFLRNNAGGTGIGIVKNCIVQGNTTNFVTANGTLTQTTNLTTGAVFVDAANKNFHLASTSSTAINSGTDLRSDSVINIKYDIDNKFKIDETADIGASEYGAISASKFEINEDYEFTQSGGWCWVNQTHAYTYNGATYYTWCNQIGQLKIGKIIHATGAVTSYTIGTVSTYDDHNAPCLWMRSDGRIVVFYRNEAATSVLCRISAKPEDITTWWTERTIASGRVTVSYPLGIRLSSESNKFYCLWTDGADSYLKAWSTSTDIDSISSDTNPTWSAPEIIHSTVATPLWLYDFITTNGTDTIYFANSAHPQVSATSSVYAFYYKTNAFYDPDGTKIIDYPAGIPVTTAALNASALVYDGTTNKAWVYDVAMDGTTPVIAFTKYLSTYTDHRYMYAKWDGSAWGVNQIDTGGGSCASNTDPGVGCLAYSGGITIDKNDPDIVYYSKGTSATKFDIYKGVTANSGSTWSNTAQTNDAIYKNIRPYCPINGDDAMPVMWMAGYYKDYLDYTTEIAKTIKTNWVFPTSNRYLLTIDGQVKWNNTHDAITEFTDGYFSQNYLSGGLIELQGLINWDDEDTLESVAGLYLYETSNYYAAITSGSETGGKLLCRVVSQGTTYYCLNSSIDNNVNVKISYNANTKQIIFYYLNGDIWTQIGTTQTYNIGTCMRAGLTKGDATILNGANPLYIDNVLFRQIDKSNSALMLGF